MRFRGTEVLSALLHVELQNYITLMIGQTRYVLARDATVYTAPVGALLAL